jgi:hypothetical protein
MALAAPRLIVWAGRAAVEAKRPNSLFCLVSGSEPTFVARRLEVDGLILVLLTAWLSGVSI